MLEWLKRHAWKACKRPKRFGGSNPPLSAKYPKAQGFRTFLRKIDFSVFEQLCTKMAHSAL